MKILSIISAAALTLALGSCASRATSDLDVIYSGVLPAADAEGVEYTLHLDYDDSGTKGDYDLTEKYLVPDSVAATSQTSFKTEGDFTVETGTPADPKQKYIKLVPDGTDAQPVYFIINSGNALTLTGSDLVAPDTPGLNYTLVRR